MVILNPKRIRFGLIALACVLGVDILLPLVQLSTLVEILFRAALFAFTLVHIGGNCFADSIGFPPPPPAHFDDDPVYGTRKS